MDDKKYINVLNDELEHIFKTFIEELEMVVISNTDLEADTFYMLSDLVEPLYNREEHDPLYFPISFLRYILIGLNKDYISLKDAYESVKLYYDQINIAPKYKNVNDIIKTMYIDIYEPSYRESQYFDHELYSKYLEELVANDDIHAKEIKAYLYYGDGSVYTDYHTDYAKCKDILLELMNDDRVSDLDKGRYANTLGYIYYYGRTTNGVPDYDSAIKYYSLGHAVGFYESTIKLSDCFYGGKGVPKNKAATLSLLSKINDELYHDFAEGYTDSPFGDFALRLGRIHKDGNLQEDRFYAVYFYILAAYALNIRLNCENNFYDKSLVERAEKEVSELYKNIDNYPISKNMTSRNVIKTIYQIVDNQEVNIEIKELKNHIKLIIKPNRADNVIVCLPEFGYAQLVDKAVFKFNKSEEFILHNQYDTMYPRGVDFDDDSNELLIFENRDSFISLKDVNCTFVSNLKFTDQEFEMINNAEE